jgi:hypothetical protein
MTIHEKIIFKWYWTIRENERNLEETSESKFKDSGYQIDEQSFKKSFCIDETSKKDILMRAKQKA